MSLASAQKMVHLQQNRDHARPSAGRESLFVDGNNLPEGMIIILRSIGPNDRAFLYRIPSQGVEGIVDVLEHSYIAKAIIALLAQRPQLRELHGYMAAVGSQLHLPLPIYVHHGLSSGSIHQCKCPAALVIGQISDGAVVLDPVLFMCNNETHVW